MRLLALLLLPFLMAGCLFNINKKDGQAISFDNLSTAPIKLILEDSNGNILDVNLAGGQIIERPVIMSDYPLKVKSVSAGVTRDSMLISGPVNSTDLRTKLQIDVDGEGKLIATFIYHE